MRLFVAVDIPEAHKRSIEKALQGLRVLLPDARWAPRSNWHATLKFLGEVPDDKLPEVRTEIASSVGDSRPVRSSLTELGAFPSIGRARVLWVGLGDASGELARLAAELDSKLSLLGVRSDSRPLHPHVTVARMRIPLQMRDLLQEAGPFVLERKGFTISQAVLYRSHLKPTGAEYEPLATFPATGALPAR